MGAGGHARETLGIFEDINQVEKRWKVLGFIDEDPDKHGQILDAVPVLGGFDWFSNTSALRQACPERSRRAQDSAGLSASADKGEVRVISTIGDTSAQRQMVEKALALRPFDGAQDRPFGYALRQAPGPLAPGTKGSGQAQDRQAQDTALGLKFCSAISPLAHISPYAKLGTGIMVAAYSIINTGAVIGNHTIINVACTISHDTIVGSFCNINPGVHLAGEVRIGEGCYIGMGANVIQGVSIGPWTIVGAGAVVVGDLPANVTAVGVPAQVVKTRL